MDWLLLSFRESYPSTPGRTSFQLRVFWGYSSLSLPLVKVIVPPLTVLLVGGGFHATFATLVRSSVLEIVPHRRKY